MFQGHHVYCYEINARPFTNRTLYKQNPLQAEPFTSRTLYKQSLLQACFKGIMSVAVFVLYACCCHALYTKLVLNVDYINIPIFVYSQSNFNFQHTASLKRRFTVVVGVSLCVFLQ